MRIGPICRSGHIPTKPGTPAPRNNRSKIVSGVRQRDFLDAGSLAHACKEFMPGAPRAIFIAPHLARFDCARQTVARRKLTNEFGVGIAVGPAKLVVKVTDVRMPARFYQHVEQRNRIRPAGDTDQQRLAGGE
jgi:hypothetical protein